MTQLATLDDRSKALQHVFTANAQAMAKMVPRTMGDPSRLLRIAYNTVAYDPLLLETSKTPAGMASIVGGVMEALKLGLTIGGPMQESFLIPFRNKGVLEATLIVGFMGYRNILDRGKSVLDLQPRAVFANDEFDVNFGTSKVFHKPYWLLGKDKPGDLVAVYCIAHLPRGGVQVEVMPKAEVDEHRARSRAKDSGPWVTDYNAMALKTVIRKIAKYLPKSSEILMRALDLDQKADLGVSQDFDLADIVFDEGPPASKQVGSSRLEALKKTLAAPTAGNGGQKLPAAKAEPVPVETPKGAVAVPTAETSPAPPAATQTAAEAQHHVAMAAGHGVIAFAGPVEERPSEEALRELDEALGVGASSILEVAMEPPSAGQQAAHDEVRRVIQDMQAKEEAAILAPASKEENAKLDAEIAARETPPDGGMTPIGGLFGGVPSQATALQEKVEALRKRAEELANARKRRP